MLVYFLPVYGYGRLQHDASAPCFTDVLLRRGDALKMLSFDIVYGFVRVDLSSTFLEPFSRKGGSSLRLNVDRDSSFV